MAERAIKTQQLNIERTKCIQLADEFFRDASGIYGDGDGLEEFRVQAERAINLCEDRFAPRAVYAFYDEPAIQFHGRKLRIEEIEFLCPAFEQIDPGTVKGVYAYAISAGDFSFPQHSVVDQVYADLWGTALTDAIREMMNEELRSLEPGAGISDDFGPGFYGMDAAQMLDMPKVVDFKQAGVTLNESGFMTPVKSCTGLLFKVTAGYRKMSTACQDCQGAILACRLCRNRRFNQE